MMFAAMALIPTSCIETPESQVQGKGTNRIRMQGDEFEIVTFKPFATETKSLITIYRDAISNASMNESVSVNLTIDEALLDAYNEEHETDFILLDPAAYTLSVPEGTVTFAPGESAKTIRITLNTGLLDLTEKHVLPFVVSNPSSGFVVNERFGATIVQTLPINKYDGKYTVEGSLTDVVVTSIDGSCAYPMTAELHTSGENSVILFDAAIGGYYHSICSAGELSYYGNAGVEFTFDANNKVISAKNIYTDPLPRGRSFELDPSGVNTWDPDTKTLKVKYWLNQANTAGHRTSFDETYTFEGPR